MAARGYNLGLPIYQSLRRDVSSVTNKDYFERILNKVIVLLESGEDISQPELYISDVKSIVKSQFYCDICNDLLDCLGMPCLQDVDCGTKEKLQSLILNGPAKKIFFFLVSKFSEHECHSYVLYETNRIIASFVMETNMTEMLWEECKILPPPSLQRNSNIGAASRIFDENLVTLLSSLPNRVANKISVKKESVLHSSNYFSRLTVCICDALEKVHHSLAVGNDCSLVFISQLFAKLCLLRYDFYVYDYLLPKFESWSKISPLWTRICSYFFLKCPDSNFDSVLEPLLKRTHNGSLLSLLLENGILNNHKIKFLLTHKYFLVRMYQDDILPWNIFSYLNRSSDRRYLIMEIFLKILEVWSDKFSLSSKSVDQHHYISRCISLATWFIGKENLKGKKGIIMKLLLSGVTAHLESPIERIRMIGMTIAEVLSKKLDEEKHSLKFDFEKDEECSLLIKLAESPQILMENTGKLKDEEVVSSFSTDTCGDQGSNLSEETANNYDSDDDFEPYEVDDVDENACVNGVSPPLYIRDCLSGILAKDDPNRIEASLRVFERLIWNESGDLEDISVEITKVLLYLDDQYGLPGFVALRFNSMVAICCRCPKIVATYLAREFYAENYNIRQRLDILDVLASAASQLSRPEVDKLSGQKPSLPLSKVEQQKRNHQEDWRRVIEDRLAKKTKYFAKANKKSVEAVSNLFANVAGFFFFPLMKCYDSSQLSFDLLGQDSFLLGRLIYTAGSILHDSNGLPIVHRMVGSALEVVWTLRFHKEPFVRQSLIYFFCMAVMSCTPAILLTDFSKEIFDGKEWLEDVIRMDPNKECQKIASQSLAIIESVIRTIVLDH